MTVGLYMHGIGTHGLLNTRVNHIEIRVQDKRYIPSEWGMKIFES